MRGRTCGAAAWLLALVILASCGITGELPEAGGGTPASGDGGYQSGPAPPSPVIPEMPHAPTGCGGRIAFVAPAGAEREIFVIDADGSGLAQVTTEPGWERSPSWSPDGTRILFERHVGNADIFVVDADGSMTLRLTDDPGRDYAPVWSPQGGLVLFASTRVFASDLFVVRAGGGEAVPLTGTRTHKVDFAWSPDGSYIAFTMLDDYNQGDVFVVDAPDEWGASGREIVNLTEHPANDCCVAWAPDSERLLFLSSRSGKAAGAMLQVRRNNGGHTGLLPGASPDGAPESSVNAVRPVTTVMPEPPRDIYIIHRDGSGLARLTAGGGTERQASWSPDGTRVAFVSDRDGNDEIYIMAVADGTGEGRDRLIRLTDSLEDEAYPTWSPDGACVAFESNHDGIRGLYVIQADGAGLRKLVDDVHWGAGISWAP